MINAFYLGCFFCSLFSNGKMKHKLKMHSKVHKIYLIKLLEKKSPGVVFKKNLVLFSLLTSKCSFFNMSLDITFLYPIVKSYQDMKCHFVLRKGKY